MSHKILVRPEGIAAMSLQTGLAQDVIRDALQKDGVEVREVKPAEGCFFVGGYAGFPGFAEESLRPLRCDDLLHRVHPAKLGPPVCPLRAALDGRSEMSKPETASLRDLMVDTAHRLTPAEQYLIAVAIVANLEKLGYKVQIVTDAPQIASNESPVAPDQFAQFDQGQPEQTRTNSNQPNFPNPSTPNIPAPASTSSRRAGPPKVNWAPLVFLLTISAITAAWSPIIWPAIAWVFRK